MMQKFEIVRKKKIKGNLVVFKLRILKIMIGEIEYWSYTTTINALSPAGEEFSIKCFA